MATSLATTRHSAARLTRGSQIATIALAGLAAAAFVFGIPGSTPEKPTETLTTPQLPPIPRPQAMARGPAPDLVAVADRFATIANAPKPREVATTDVSQPGGVAAVPPPPPPPPVDIKYLGHVGLGGTLFAMVNENQRQQVVGVNDELAAGRVVDITPSELTLDRDGTRRVIELAAKSGSAISMISPISATTTRGVRGGSRGQISPSDLMSRSRPVATGPVLQPVNNLQDPAGQAWQSNFEAAMGRLRESGQFKDEAQAKEAAMRYADELARVNADIANGLDPEKADTLLKEVDKSLAPGGRK